MALAGKKKDDPSTTSVAWDTMMPRWQLMSALLGGTETMRAAGQAYLPRHPEESDPAYQERLSEAVLYNKTALTLDDLVGRVFCEPVQPGEDMPEDIAKLCENIDGQGHDLHTFAEDWFKAGFAKGLSHAFIDFPAKIVAVNPDGSERRLTLAEAKQQNRRPYWVQFAPEQIIFAAAQVVNGVETLTHIRILEEELVQEGFAEGLQRRIRVLEPGRWWVYIEQKPSRWVLFSQGTYDLDYIPLVTFYAGDREGLMTAKPPLLDLAHLNVTHWQSSADQRNILKVGRFPMLAVSGAIPASTDGKIQLVVGPNQLLHTEDAQGKIYYVEPAGTAIAAGQEDLTQLEEQMSAYGSRFTTRKAVAQTATENDNENDEDAAELEKIARRFKDCLEQAAAITADWLGKAPEEGGSVEMNTELGDTNSVDQTVLSTLTSARNSRDISRKTYLSVLQQRGVLPEEVDIDEEIEAVEAEVSDELAAQAEFEKASAGEGPAE
jgi:hypothetical protein